MNKVVPGKKFVKGHRDYHYLRWPRSSAPWHLAWSGDFSPARRLLHPHCIHSTSNLAYDCLVLRAAASRAPPKTTREKDLMPKSSKKTIRHQSISKSIYRSNQRKCTPHQSINQSINQMECTIWMNWRVNQSIKAELNGPNQPIIQSITWSITIDRQWWRTLVCSVAMPRNPFNWSDATLKAKEGFSAVQVWLAALPTFGNDAAICMPDFAAPAAGTADKSVDKSNGDAARWAVSWLFKPLPICWFLLPMPDEEEELSKIAESTNSEGATAVALYCGTAVLPGWLGTTLPFPPRTKVLLECVTYIAGDLNKNKIRRKNPLIHKSTHQINQSRTQTFE